MAWNWPIASQLFGNQFAAVNDWVGKYGWVFWVVLIIIIIIIAVWAYSVIRRR